MQSDINAIYVIFTLEIHFVYFWSNTEYYYWEIKKLPTAATAMCGALLSSRRQLTRLKTESCSNCKQSADACDKKDENKVKIEAKVKISVCRLLVKIEKNYEFEKMISIWSQLPAQKKPTNQITLWTQSCKFEFRF